jgi:hypothetical protein
VLFPLKCEVLPLPNLGLWPKNSVTVLAHSTRIVTDTVSGAGAADPSGAAGAGGGDV